MAKNTKALLHFDDNIANSANYVFTMHGNPKIKSDKFAIGTRSLYLDGSSYLEANNTINLSTGDFTVEWFEYRTSAANNLTPLSFDNGTTAVYDLVFGYSNGTNVVAYASSNNTGWDILNALKMGTISLNEWAHFALVRSGDKFITYKNGIKVSTATSSLPIKFDHLTKILIGNRLATANGIFGGYLDEIRISNVARYTEDTFTVPTVAFTEDANTKLLIHFEDREDLSVLRDGSALRNWTLNPGTPSISAVQSKVPGGKSLYIPSASTSYGVSTPMTDDFKFGSEDFTIEMFVFPTQQLSGQGYLYTTNGNGYYENVGVLLTNTTQLHGFVSVTGNSWIDCYCDGVVLNQWNHISVNRKGNELYCTVNGVKGTASAISGSIVNTTSSPVKIGSYYTGLSSQFIGYIDEVRVSKGVARYTADYAVPAKLSLEWNNVAYLTNDDKLYGKVGTTFTKLSDTYSAMTTAAAKVAIDSTDTNTATVAELRTIGAFKVLITDTTSRKIDVNMSVVNKDTLITPKGLILLKSIEGIDKVSLTKSITGTGSCRLLVTNDLTTYKTFDGTNFVDIDHTDINSIKTNGITPEVLTTITREQWDTLTVGKSGIGFAYLPTIEDTSDVAYISNISMTADMKGSWKRAKEANFDYEYPLNDVLRISIINDGSYKINYKE